MLTLSEAGAPWSRLLDSIAAGSQQMPVESHPDFPDEPDCRRLLFGQEGERSGRMRGGLARVSRPRTIPWHGILRVSHVGQGLPRDSYDELADTLVALARESRALRLHAELWQADPVARTALIDALLARGFTPAALPRMYTATILIDLAESEAALLASFSPTCRRHIRAPDKLGLRMAPIVLDRFADRLASLDDETMRRTGGRVSPIDWPGMIRFARSHPGFATAIGISRGDPEDASALIGYVLGVRHGDTVEYFRAASSRPADHKAPLLYAPAWEVMRWGKANGARWFDFGGISAASREGTDPTGGVSDFKKSYRIEVVEVGGELVFAPSPVLDSLARSISRLVAVGERARR